MVRYLIICNMVLCWILFRIILFIVPHNTCRVYLVAQTVNNLPAMQETQI